MSYSGFWKRWLAAMADSLLLVPIAWVLGFGANSFMAEAGVDYLSPTAIFGVPALQMVALWLYFALMESSSAQATLGKMVLGIRVVGLGGERISFLRASGRYFAKIVSALVLMVGYLMAGFTQRKQALHDMIAGCLVVDK